MNHFFLNNISIKKIGLAFYFLMSSVLLIGQDLVNDEDYTTQKFPHKIFLEVGGQSGLAINYERYFQSKSETYRSFRIGATYLNRLVLPVGFNFNRILNEYHQFSIGPGINFYVDNNLLLANSTLFDRITGSVSYDFAGNIGYHYSGSATDLSIGFVITPVLELDNFRDPNFFVTVGGRIGYHF